MPTFEKKKRVFDSSSNKNKFKTGQHHNAKRPRQSGCFGCGSTENFVANCPKRQTCSFCTKFGHSEKTCRFKAKSVTAVSVPSGLVPVTIDDKEIQMLVDTGSEVSMIRKSIVRKCEIKLFRQSLQGFDEQVNWNIGKTNLPIQLNGITVLIDLMVLNDSDLIYDGVFGRDFNCFARTFM